MLESETLRLLQWSLDTQETTEHSYNETEGLGRQVNQPLVLLLLPLLLLSPKRLKNIPYFVTAGENFHVFTIVLAGRDKQNHVK